jgi:hypothetical protein
VRNKLTKYPDTLLSLIEAILPTRWSSLYPNGTYKGNFSVENYSLLARIIDIDKATEDIKQKFSRNELSTKDDINYNDKEGPYQTPINIVKQFLERHEFARRSNI